MSAEESKQVDIQDSEILFKQDQRLQLLSAVTEDKNMASASNEQTPSIHTPKVKATERKGSTQDAGQLKHLETLETLLDREIDHNSLLRKQLREKETQFQDQARNHEHEKKTNEKTMRDLRLDLLAKETALKKLETEHQKVIDKHKKKLAQMEKDARNMMDKLIDLQQRPASRHTGHTSDNLQLSTNPTDQGVRTAPNLKVDEATSAKTANSLAPIFDEGTFSFRMDNGKFGVSEKALQDSSSLRSNAVAQPESLFSPKQEGYTSEKDKGPADNTSNVQVLTDKIKKDLNLHPSPDRREDSLEIQPKKSDDTAPRTSARPGLAASKFATQRLPVDKKSPRKTAKHVPRGGMTSKIWTRKPDESCKISRAKRMAPGSNTTQRTMTTRRLDKTNDQDTAMERRPVLSEALMEELNELMRMKGSHRIHTPRKDSK